MATLTITQLDVLQAEVTPARCLHSEHLLFGFSDVDAWREAEANFKIDVLWLQSPWLLNESPTDPEGESELTKTAEFLGFSPQEEL